MVVTVLLVSLLQTEDPAPVVAVDAGAVLVPSEALATPDPIGGASLSPDAGVYEDPDLLNAGSQSRSSDATNFHGIRGYLGLSASAGQGSPLEINWGGGGASLDSGGTTLQLAVRAGVWIHRFNLDLELAPGSDLAFTRPILAKPSGPKTLRASLLARVSLAVVATVLADGGEYFDQPGAVSVGWPFRLWVGVSWPGFADPVSQCQGGPPCTWQPYVEQPAPSLQLSLIGVAFRTRRLHLELNALSPFAVFNRTSWLGLVYANVSAVFLF